MMAKISMLEASKRFNVSRPTILKHLQQGKLTGEKIIVDKNTFWQIELSELQRVYEPRVDGAAPSPDLAANLTMAHTPASPDLHNEIMRLQAALDAEREMRRLVEANLEDLRAAQKQITDRTVSPAGSSKSLFGRLFSR
jgi:hypothetical protein